MSFRFVFCLFVAFCLPTFAAASGKSFKDRDWNVRMIDNCGFPMRSGPDQSVNWVNVEGERKLAFVLRPGERGSCPTDDQARNRAPYWERAEVRQDPKMKLGQRYKISFEVTFLQGFTGDRETFFQIHSWDNGCPAYPLIMMKSIGGRMVIWGLHKVSGDGLGDRRGQHREIQTVSQRIPPLYGKPSQFTLDLDTRTNPAKVSVWMNGEVMVSQASVQYSPCAAPTIKFGIYRPGGAGSPTSAALFDKIQLTTVR